jgi:hypothetical protein
MAIYSRQVSLSLETPSAEQKDCTENVELDRSTRILSPGLEMISEDTLLLTL